MCVGDARLLSTSLSNERLYVRVSPRKSKQIVLEESKASPRCPQNQGVHRTACHCTTCHHLTPFDTTAPPRDTSFLSLLLLLV